MTADHLTLSTDILAELPRRLYEAAEAFYYAGILTCASFDAANVHVKLCIEAAAAADAALTGQNRNNTTGAPPIVNFGFSIELYLKFLRFLTDGVLTKTHDLHCLFLQLEKVAPEIAAAVIKNHRYARGERDEFIADIRDVKSVFTDWRYAFEKEILISSPDSLLALADAFRDTVREQNHNLQSAFANDC